VGVGAALGAGRRESREAFRQAVEAQMAFHAQCQAMGRQVLEELQAHPEQVAIVVFGRPYNAFVARGNMGVPRKFSSRGYTVIPHDCLPWGEEPIEPDMYWAMGQQILRAARLCRKHPRLFPVYITNFSCGPDSFLNGYFKSIMGSKPALVLELDSHTADAGLDTRVEAFLDVVHNYLETGARQESGGQGRLRVSRTALQGGKMWVQTAEGRQVAMDDPEVHLLIPSMGYPGAELLAAAFRYVGVRASALPPAGERELRLGQGYASCKECLPLMLTLGSLMRYLEDHPAGQEQLVYFMPVASGPCRFGQYSVLMRDYIAARGLQNVSLLSLSAENGYAGFGNRLALRAWQAVVLADVLEEIRSEMLAAASDAAQAMAVFDSVCQRLAGALATQSWRHLRATLAAVARTLKTVPRSVPPHQVPRVA
ncbi:MAG: acyl-CoA dehydratase activase-related protein, partial [Syntrophomonadaceae bacterium]|nr:acyl-CoA dehydratase activase-related protein [Syntrophomonadaceae bacterium]